MKIRSDFVTNSSSSSFILARKGMLNEAQKSAVMNYIENELLGQAINTIDEWKQFAKENYIEEDTEIYQVGKDYLEKGYSLSGDLISFECISSWDYAEILKKIWKVLEDTGEGNFVGLDTELVY